MEGAPDLAGLSVQLWLALARLETYAPPDFKPLTYAPVLEGLGLLGSCPPDAKLSCEWADLRKLS